MKPKTLFLLSVLAGLAAVGLVALQQYLDKGDARKVFLAIDDVGVGEKVGQRFELVPLPEKHFPNILKEAPDETMKEFVVGTPVRLGIQRGEIILFRHLEGTVDPGVRALIPAGKLAVSVEVDETSSVSYLVQPGDSVDVWVAGASERGQAEIKPLVEDVFVLAVGNEYRRGAPLRRGRRPYTAVTLAVAQEQAKALILVRDVLGQRMTLVLRSAEAASES